MKQILDLADMAIESFSSTKNQKSSAEIVSLNMHSNSISDWSGSSHLSGLLALDISSNKVPL